jgi:hypothetical protein
VLIISVIQFGVPVLLDSIWNVNRLGSCSKTFRAVFDILQGSRPSGYDCSRQSSAKVLKAVVHVLSGGKFTNYITELLHELPGPSSDR